MFDRHTSGAPIKYNFINHINTLDQNGEWCYDYATQTLTIYHATNPSSLTIMVPNVDSVLSIKDCSYVKVVGGEFWSGNMENVLINGSDHIYLDSIKTNNSAFAGVAVRASSYIYFNKNTIIGCQSNGIALMDTWVGTVSGAVTVQNSYLEGITSGWYIGDNDGRHYDGLWPGYSLGPTIISYNVIKNFGYNGIEAHYTPSQIIYRNVIDGFCLHLSDGGGIHTGWNLETTVDRIIRSNLFMNAGTNYSALQDVTPLSYGIYLDNDSKYWTVDSNTVVNVQTGAFNNYGAAYNSWRNNTFVDFDVPSKVEFLVGGYGTGPYIYWDDAINHFTWENNTIVATSSTYPAGLSWSSDGTPLSTGSVFNYNKYYNPFITNGTLFNSLNSGGTSTYYNITNWKAFTGWELMSTVTDDATGWGWSDVTGISADQFVWVFCNWSSTDHSFDLGNCTFKNLSGSNISGTVSVSPYKSQVLYYASGTLSGVDNPVYIAAQQTSWQYPTIKKKKMNRVIIFK